MNWHSEDIVALVQRALAEDVGSGDVTTAASLPRALPASAVLIARQTLVCAALPWAEVVFHALDPKLQIEILHNEGSFVQPGTELLRVAGDARPILTGERTALNFLGRLCGIATLTRRFAS